MLAGMGGVSYHHLVAAVSDAGGFGCLGASTMSAEQLAEEMQLVRAATDQPFGVDLLTAFPDTLLDQVKLLIEGGASVFVAGLGVPTPAIELCHRHNVLVVNMCGKVEHARRAVDAGCDLVVAQGTEAGGHTGQVATLPLVPQMVDAVGDRVAVVAAGGIFDGRGLAAALALGADGVWVGTRFIATPEASAAREYREALVRAHQEDTVRTRCYSGKPLRALKNPYIAEWERDPSRIKRFPEQLVLSSQRNVMGYFNPEADPERTCMPAGQGIGAFREIKPAGDVLREIVAQAEHVLGTLSASPGAGAASG
jgi:enoyl-[acyl-carrier protein] reductase II